MSRTRTRLFLSVGSAVIGAIVVWRYAVNHPAVHDSVKIVDNSGDVRQLLARRAQQGPAESLHPPSNERDSAVVHLAIPAEDAQSLFPIDDEQFVYDPWTYFRYKGGLRGESVWAEYPGGHYTRSTSLDGFREDFETLPEKRDFLAVVAGDSQTDGLCANAESFANRAEAELSARHPGRAIEVLNAGVPCSSFYNYLGTLEKMLDAKPDVFVIAFYSGNDFKDMVVPTHYFQRTLAPESQPEYVRQLKQALAINGSGTVMALNPILYFKYEPAERDLAQRAALDVCARVRRLCHEHGIELIVVRIPLAFRPGGPLPAACADARRALALTDEDMLTEDRMAIELIAKLREWKVDVLDLREHLPEDIESYYWSDMHLNVKGHAFLGRLLAPKLDSLYALHNHSNGETRPR